MYDQLFAVPPPSPREPPCVNYVDVHDVVDAHIRALEVQAAGGERIIVSSGEFHLVIHQHQFFVDVLATRL